MVVGVTVGGNDVLVGVALGVVDSTGVTRAIWVTSTVITVGNDIFGAGVGDERFRAHAVRTNTNMAPMMTRAVRGMLIPFLGGPDHRSLV
jgi:hypothetical protein